MNTKLLLEIKQDILEHPKRFRMDKFVVAIDSIAPCGTAACIAGFAVIRNQERWWRGWAKTGRKLINKGENVQILAGQLLGLDEEQEERLFFTEYWPDKFREAYGMAETREHSAEIAAQRIDHFIATKGQE